MYVPRRASPVRVLGHTGLYSCIQDILSRLESSNTESAPVTITSQSQTLTYPPRRNRGGIDAEKVGPQGGGRTTTCQVAQRGQPQPTPEPGWWWRSRSRRRDQRGPFHVGSRRRAWGKSSQMRQMRAGLR